MRRKLVSVVVSSLICLLGLGVVLASAGEVFVPDVGQGKWWSTPEIYQQETGKTIGKLSESPMLRAKVAAGDLPPIEERLPKEFLVVRPYAEIGTYADSSEPLKMLMPGPGAGGIMHMQRIGATDWNRAVTDLIPDTLKGWEFSEDAKTLTVFLRKGLRYSDGAPFTADDILFWWEDVILNELLSRVVRDYFRPGGELMKVVKIDDYTVRYEFAVPYYHAVNRILINHARLGLPQHFFKTIHIKYNPDADEVAKGYGFDNWTQLFLALASGGRPGTRLSEELNKMPPVLAPWIYKKKVVDGMIWERNPYYHHVDTAGNQLPYMDMVVISSMESAEVYQLKVLAGEADYADWVSLSMYPLLKKEADAGKYRLQTGHTNAAATLGLITNWLYDKDPVLGKILADVRFRRAISLATDREEINEILYFGLATPRQATLVPETPANPPYYNPEWAKAYAVFDPENKEANQFLDEMGLKWDKNEEYRLRPDGERLTVELMIPGDYTPIFGEIAELLVPHWKRIGVDLVIDNILGQHFYERAAANDYQLAGRWMGSNVNETISYAGDHFNPGYVQFHPAWRTWYQTSGAEGLAPPQWVQEHIDALFSLPYLSPEELGETMTKVFDLQAEQLFVIGTVGMIPGLTVINNDLGNVTSRGYSSMTEMMLRSVHPDEWFWKK